MTVPVRSWITATCALALAMSVMACSGAQTAGDQENGVSDTKKGVWATVSNPEKDTWRVKLRGDPIANQDVRWGLLTAEAAAVATGTAKTDDKGAFTVKSAKDLAVVLAIEHETWSAWAELP